MIGYVTLGTDDLVRARAYYDALLGAIGAKRLMQFGDEENGGFTLYGRSMAAPAIVLTRPHDKQAADRGNGNMVALVMDARDQVDAFHAKALELGGTDEGAPGFRGDPASANMAPTSAIPTATSWRCSISRRKIRIFPSVPREGDSRIHFVAAPPHPPLASGFFISC